MTLTKDLIKKMADFFTSEEFCEKGEDARLELSPDDVRCMCYIIKKHIVEELKRDKCEKDISLNTINKAPTIIEADKGE